MATTAASAAALPLQQYAPQAASLFNNMITPASIIAGSMVPLGLLAPVSHVRPDGTATERPIETIMRRSYTFVAVAALLSEFICIIYATVAVNQLTETVVEPARSVWHLLQRDYDLSWSGTNAHFLMGMFAFTHLIAVRSYFNVGGGLLGGGVAGIAVSALLKMVGIVNRAVATGSGDGSSYGTSVFSLFLHYYGLVLSQKGGVRPMDLCSLAVLVGSLATVAYAVLQKGKEHIN